MPRAGDAASPAAGALEVVYKPGPSPFELVDRETQDNYKGLNETELLARVEQHLLLRPAAAVIVAADRRLTHGEVMALVGKLRALGAADIGFYVQTGDDK